ncbi:MAG: DNA mismatch repair endonuclease MutL [Lentisphaerae bacterium]|nr:DNA mismatch repair endonuclease MutL [Lentisphaerota bacterium]
MGPDTHIRVLPDVVANQIAAGEVVERPASVLKELIENAVDAGATRIEVEVAAGGRKLVAVRDNGGGMDRDDALLCVERHATSKIRDVRDIEAVRTLGFRGEALAAIAAVSRFRLVTATRDGAGTELEISGGRMEAVRETGAPRGTSVEVRDLFFNVPARRKFLRSHQTEVFHLRAAFILQALAHPGTAMALKNDGRAIYALGPADDVMVRVREIFGADYAAHLRPARHGAAGVAVRGCVGVPSFSRADRGEQYLFVNGRPTGAPLIGHAIREGYRTLLPGDRHPCVFLFVETDPGQVDINVHPAKKEVRFRQPGEVRDAVIAAIAAALGSPAAAAGRAPAPAPAPPAADAGPRLQIVDLPYGRAFQYPRRPIRDLAATDAAVPGPFEETGIESAGTGPAAAPSPSSPDAGRTSPSPASISPPSPWSWCRVLGQVGGLYVVLETEDGYVLMDPHAGHERVLFERFMADIDGEAVPSQSLLLPQTVALPPRDAQRVRGCLDLLRRMGFGVSEFGGDTFVVDAMPAYFSGADAAPILGELAAAAEEGGRSAGEGRGREEAVARAACRAAVRSRDRLTLEEIERLVVELAQAAMPYTCPHGRPTLVFTSFRELSRRFGRG